MKKIILLIAVLALLFTGCKKNEDDPVPRTKTEQLTDDSWVLTDATADKAVDFDGDGNSSVDVYSQIADCDKDDFLNFFNNKNIKTGALSEGPTACNGETPHDVKTFTWAFNSTETILTVTSDDDSTNATLVELTGSTLKLSYEREDENGLSYILTETYVKRITL